MKKLSCKPKEAVMKIVESTSPAIITIDWLGRRTMLRRPMRNRMGLRQPRPKMSRMIPPVTKARSNASIVGEKLFMAALALFLSRATRIRRWQSEHRRHLLAWLLIQKIVCLNQAIRHRDEPLSLLSDLLGVRDPYKGQPVLPVE